MRPSRKFVPFRQSPRLCGVRTPDRTDLWTEAVGELPPVYGERWVESDGRLYRSFEPGRSKLAAGVVRGWAGDLPAPSERWLYLGAASGTTSSHVADLVGPEGRVYAVERSLRPFARLLGLSERWPNLLPVLADAREPTAFVNLVPPVDGVYADVAQPDQVEIVRRNAELFLRGPGARVLLALKTASMGRDLAPAGHLRRAEEEVSRFVDLAPSVKLDPFHRAHYLLGGRALPELFGEGSSPSVTQPRGQLRGRRRS